MKIKYTNTEEDIVSFNLYHCKNSAVHKRTMRSAQFLLPSLIILIFLFRYVENKNLSHLLSGIFFSGLYIIIFAFTSKRSVKRVSKKMFAEGKNKGVLCEHKIEILETGIVETTEVGKQESNWSAIERISETEDYLFIYMGSMMAHVIPKNRVDGNIEAFIKTLKEKAQQGD